MTRPTPAPSRLRRWLKRLAILLLIGAGVLLVFLIDAWTALGKSPAGDHLDRISKSPQWHDGHFDNPLPRVDDLSFGKMIKGFLFGDEIRNPEQPIEIVRPDPAMFDTPPESGLRLTWLGHSTFLIEIDGKRVLTDPVWGDRASPSSWVGPKRFYAPPLALADLPPLDAIIISHDHYDHLDWPTVAALVDHPAHFYVPLGVGAHLAYWGIADDRIHEHDWYEQSTLDGLVLAATPSRHFSGRVGPWGNNTLWASWALIGPTHRVYFSGDTAMFPGFADIGRQYGPFDITLVESGAYSAQWADVHLGPEQAVAAHEMVQGRLMIPIHWGTFNLAYHAWTEPAERVVAEAARRGVKLAVPRPGQSVDVANPPPVERWWPEIPTQSAADAPVVSSHLPPELTAR